MCKFEAESRLKLQAVTENFISSLETPLLEATSLAMETLQTDPTAVGFAPEGP